MTYNDSRLGQRPNGSAFVRKSSAVTAGRPSDGSSPRIRPPEPTRGSRPIPGRTPLSAQALLTAAQKAPPIPPRPPHSASTTPPVATPTTVSYTHLTLPTNREV